MYSFNVEKNQKLIKFIQEKFNSSIKYSQILKLIKNKDVKVNGKRISKDIDLNVGDKIDIYTNIEIIKYQPEIVFVDENILIIDKPIKKDYLSILSDIKEFYPTAVAVHRLDTNTTGIMIFALNEKSEKELLNAFKKGDIQKKYITEVYGSFDNNELILEDYLVKDSDSGIVKIYKNKVKNSLTVKTGYKVLQRLTNSTILEVTLYTGRTHQIRAHLAFYGHFVIGDGKYGKEKINRQFNANYQRLCAYKITFKFSENSLLNYLNGKEISLSRNAF